MHCKRKATKMYFFRQLNVKKFKRGSKEVRKGFERGSKGVRKGFERGSKEVRKRFERGSKEVRKRCERGGPLNKTKILNKEEEKHVITQLWWEGVTKVF